MMKSNDGKEVKRMKEWIVKDTLNNKYVQELVRCKDCIHYRYYGVAYGTVSECTIDHCENPDKDWFCADGKKEKVR